jgi:hypothetical protein
MKLLFRRTLAEEDEYEVATKYFGSHVIESRTQIEPGDLVVGRYSVLPYYRELAIDVNRLGAEMLTSYREHNYVADLREWYQDLEQFTPKTWFSLAEAVASPWPGPFVLKGATNSRKNLWRTHMYAEDKESMREVYFRLMDDTMIGDQGVYIRQYEPLVQYGVSLSGIPVSKEFRFFVLKGKVIARGFYWSSQLDLFEGSEIPDVAEVPEGFIQEIIDAVGDSIDFWVFDAAQRLDGVWRVVELNDGQMSGLSCCSADDLYRGLAELKD